MNLRYLIISLFWLLLITRELFAQQRIRSAGFQMVTNAPLMINPQDTLFLKMYNENKSLPIAQFFMSMPGMKFYSIEEIKIILKNIDKMWNPDKYFENESDYSSFVKTWLDELAAEHKRAEYEIRKNNKR